MDYGLLVVSGAIVSTVAAVFAYHEAHRANEPRAVVDLTPAVLAPLAADIAAARIELAGLRGAVRVHLSSCPAPGDLQDRLDEVP